MEKMKHMIGSKMPTYANEIIRLSDEKKFVSKLLEDCRIFPFLKIIYAYFCYVFCFSVFAIKIMVSFLFQKFDMESQNIDTMSNTLVYEYLRTHKTQTFENWQKS